MSKHENQTKLSQDQKEEEPDVQWEMKYTAGQIGKWQMKYRNRCIKMGKETGLYQEEMVTNKT